MKKYKLYINLSTIVLCSILLMGCNDFLDITPKNFITDDAVWTTPSSADLFLNDIYEQLPNMNGETEHLDQFTDNSDVGVLWMRGYSNIATAQLTPTNYPDVPDKMWYWSKSYERIRKCNIFIKKVSESSLSDDYKKLRISEARFLRAMFYHWLWKAHGGVPIIEVPLDNISMGEEMYYPRSTARQTFEFITKELGEIANDLPLKITNDGDYGRPTKGAALTLKAWCELYEASPLRNPSNDIERWKLAAKTNKEVIDLGVYDLFDDFGDLFMAENNNSIESIFARQHGPKKGTSIDFKQGPTMNGVGAQVCWGNSQPTQELVDEFSMASGKTITEDPAYDPQNPYVGREKRFYQSILYNGATWRDYIIETRVGGTNEIDLGYAGDKSHTGYFARKRLDERTNPSNSQNGESYQNYMYFRYAEVLLSYAEAENEVNGPTKDVLDAVNKVRTRGENLPTVQSTYGTVDKDKMREIIHRERRVELSFEDKRWWDILRWKIADKLPDGSPGVLNRPEKGMYITKNNDGTLNYKIVDVRNRLFLPKMYLMPVPQSVIDQNPSIAAQSGGEDNWTNGQNPGY